MHHSSSFENDIAIFRFSTLLPEGNNIYIKIIPLPTLSPASQDLSQDNCMVSGWGQYIRVSYKKIESCSKKMYTTQC